MKLIDFSRFSLFKCAYSPQYKIHNGYFDKNDVSLKKKRNKSTDEEEDLSPIFQGNTKQLPNKNSIHFPISAGTSLSLLLKFSSFRKFLFLLIFPVRKIFLVTSWKI